MLFSRRFTAAAAAAAWWFSTSALADDSDSVQLFIDNIDPNAGWAASIQNACNGSTTYVVSCTSAPGDACNIATATITEGPSFFIITTPAIYSETSATITETCSLNSASNSASCMQTVVASEYGNIIATTNSYNLTGTAYHQYDVSVTGGAKHTRDGGSCKAHVSGAERRRGDVLQATVVIGGLMMFGVLGVVLL